MRNLLKPFMSENTGAVQSSSNSKFLDIFVRNRSINSSNAQRIADVFACVNLKANTLATIPLKLYKTTDKGKEEHREHNLYTLLRREPNPNLTYYEWAKMISQDLDLRGNHYCQIVKNGMGEVVALYPLKHDSVSVEFVNQTNKSEKIYKYGSTSIPSNRILHLVLLVYQK
jgi:HK97 family phage portal protein